MATIAGLVLNCANSALYMANYNLVVRLLPDQLRFTLNPGRL